jgi:SSS family solute:Na+ symporter
MYQSAKSIINLLQQLNGLLSMPILSAFIAGLMFRGVSAPAAIAGVVWGVGLYGAFTFVLEPRGIIAMHYIDFMVVTLITSVSAALFANRLMGGKATFSPFWTRGAPA